MHPHDEVTLSYLWHFVQQFFDFVKCDCKHCDDQRIVDDEHRFCVGWKEEEDHGYEHAEDGK